MSQNCKATLITTLATVFVGLATPANALNNGDIYEFCKPYVDGAFRSTDVDSLTCVTFFRATADAGYRLCDTWGDVITDEQYPSDVRNAISIVRSAEGLKFVKQGELRAAMQHYVNNMSKNPEKWKYNASFDVLKSLQKMAPCE